MKIRVIDSNQEIVTLLRGAGLWFADQLLNPFQIEILKEIKIHTCYNQLKIDAMGMCWSIQKGGERPRDFEVLIANDLDTYWKVRTLAHEFVHVKQHVNRELTYENGERHWKGKPIGHLPYERFPHEIEANALEAPLADKFLIKFCGYRRKKTA